MRILVLLVMLLGTQFLFGDDNKFAVGACKPKLKSFTTIQTAVSGVPPGSTVLVCPGTYFEQVTISQSLTLQGIADSNSDEVIIAIPSGGPRANVTSIFNESVSAQVLVQTTGEVDISNITTDGTGGDSACVNWLVGIFYSSGSSGSVSRVRTRNQIDGGCGVGIWAENGSTSRDHVSVQGSSVHDADIGGIFLGTQGTSVLNVDIRDNFVSPNSLSAIDIVAEGVTGEVSDNDLSAALGGIFELAPGLDISANGIIAADNGLVLLAPVTVRSNDIMNSGVGVAIAAPGSTLQSNRITQSSTAIEFSCLATNGDHNTINDAGVGLSDVPASFSGTNNIANTTTVSTVCLAAAAVSPQFSAAPLATMGSPYLQWRTPANPKGSRP
jgi:hypothetical protein